jgi:hypothetical protein
MTQRQTFVAPPAYIGLRHAPFDWPMGTFVIAKETEWKGA